MTADTPGSAANLAGLCYLLRGWTRTPQDENSARLADAYDAVLSLLEQRADDRRAA